MMKKTVALLAVAGLAAATSDFQDDYLALRLTNATRHANSTRVNTTHPIKPIKPIRPHPVRPGMIPKDRVTISTKNLTKEEREILNRLYKKQTEKTHQHQHQHQQSKTVRPKPHTNATNSTKPVHPKKILAQRLDDDEFYAEDDEFFAEDDEFYAEDDEFFAEDDEFYAEDDFFYAEDDEYFTAKNVTIKPHVKPSHIKANHTMIPRPRPGMIPRPKVNSTAIPRPVMIPRHKVNSTAIPRPRPGTLINHRPRVNSTKPVHTKPTRLPIKPERNATKILARDDDEFFAEDDEFFADEDEFWVDIDDEFFAEDDEFYAEDDEFYAEDDEFYAEDDEFYAEDDEFFAPRNASRPVGRPSPFFNRNHTTHRPTGLFRTRVNGTEVRPRPHPRPTTLFPRHRVNGTEVRPRPHPRPQVDRPFHPRPHRNTTTGPKRPTFEHRPTRLPIKPERNATKILARDDDEFFAEDDEFFADEDEFWVDIDDEFFAEDDEFYAEDDEFYAEDDEFFAEDDEFYAEDDEFFVPRNASRPVGRPSPFFNRNHTTHRPTGLFRPRVNGTEVRPRPHPRPTALFPRHRVNGTEVRPRPHPRPQVERPFHPRPQVDRPFHPRPHRNTTTGPKRPTFEHRPTRLPIKPERNATKILARDDDEFFAEDDEFFADEDEFWVDIDDEFFAEDDEFYAEDDEFYAEDDEFYAEDDEFYAEDDEYFVDADDDFFAARLHNRTQTVKPARNSTLGRLDSLLKEAKKDVIKAKDTLKNATRPAIKEIKHDFKNLTAKGKELFKNATKPAAPKKGFLSMF